MQGKTQTPNNQKIQCHCQLPSTASANLHSSVDTPTAPTPQSVLSRHRSLSSGKPGLQIIQANKIIPSKPNPFQLLKFPPTECHAATSHRVADFPLYLCGCQYLQCAALSSVQPICGRCPATCCVGILVHHLQPIFLSRPAPGSRKIVNEHPRHQP